MLILLKFPFVNVDVRSRNHRSSQLLLYTVYFPGQLWDTGTAKFVWILLSIRTQHKSSPKSSDKQVRWLFVNCARDACVFVCHQPSATQTMLTILIALLVYMLYHSEFRPYAKRDVLHPGQRANRISVESKRKDTLLPAVTVTLLL